jgi:hypothetical protein
MFSDVEGISLKQEKHGKNYFPTIVSNNRFPETQSGRRLVDLPSTPATKRCGSKIELLITAGNIHR